MKIAFTSRNDLFILHDQMKYKITFNNVLSNDECSNRKHELSYLNYIKDSISKIFRINMRWNMQIFQDIFYYTCYLDFILKHKQVVRKATTIQCQFYPCAISKCCVRQHVNHKTDQEHSLVKQYCAHELIDKPLVK